MGPCLMDYKFGLASDLPAAKEREGARAKERERGRERERETERRGHRPESAKEREREWKREHLHWEPHVRRHDSALAAEPLHACPTVAARPS